MTMKIGFEIHQQLETRKLFCACPSLLREEDADFKIERRLRPTQSELGETDMAAMLEFMKGRSFVYEGYRNTTCLVEADEEPPHSPNDEAVEIALQMAALLHARIVDEIQFMRKLVIDGSNTSGFQRTTIVAMDGYVETEGGRIGIPTICLEEEAARKIREDDRAVTYRLDRLGIPLIEIATAPDIRSGEQARDVALKIGEMLRATGRVKRGIGTIRQDVNISIEGGARVEVKGVQELNQIPAIVDGEVARQKRLLEAKMELERRGIGEEELGAMVQDLTEVFRVTGSKVIGRKMEEGGCVLAVRLKGFRGLLKGNLGPELAQYARTAGAKGIFHLDELPSYGISQGEVDGVSRTLCLGPEDAFVLVAEERRAAERALQAVIQRARMALRGVPEETRVAQEDGSTTYMRPLPGASRMYPETDIPPVAVAEERKARARAAAPELFEAKAGRFARDYGLGPELASQLVRSDHSDLFEAALKKFNLPPAVVANTLLGTLKDLRRGGVAVDKLPREALLEIFGAVARGEAAKEAIPDLLTAMARSPAKGLGEIMVGMGVTSMGEGEVAEVVRRVLQGRADFVREKGSGALKPLMGVVMKEVRGRADGELVNKVLKREMKRVLEEKGI